ncbi:hypothetical protein DYD21_20275 [Rhodohalobacter sp. SW132]|uniref:hypothetical protein n=1 Tax=Rhodohalobacter sp. SW132 TaxID=2293433 RepID=UPI000E21C4F5|nr:hypothetical protein [Rhodohalobacter sp. SW132]REL24024.1 hypothetical protein DYD21_20275 [Rhodohalobacter sp. SW132]
MNFDQEVFCNIKIYKTNVREPSQGRAILDEIRLNVPGSDPSFDIDDCDKVLRVETQKEPINDSKIRGLVEASGFHIEDLL